MPRGQAEGREGRGFPSPLNASPAMVPCWECCSWALDLVSALGWGLEALASHPRRVPTSWLFFLERCNLFFPCFLFCSLMTSQRGVMSPRGRAACLLGLPLPLWAGPDLPGPRQDPQSCLPCADTGLLPSQLYRFPLSRVPPVVLGTQVHTASELHLLSVYSVLTLQTPSSGEELGSCL